YRDWSSHVCSPDRTLAPRFRGRLLSPTHAHAAAQVVDREEQPAAEAGCERAILPSSQETRLEQHLITHAQPFHCVEERLALGRVSETERLDGLEIEVPGRQVIAGYLRLGILEQLAREPVRRRRHGTVERLPGIGAGGSALRDGDA